MVEGGRHGRRPLVGVGRRGFLGGLGWLATGGARVAHATPRPPATASEAAWRALAQRISGGVVRPEDAGFDRLIRPSNLRYAAIRPAGIARCRTTEDVRAAILWARDTATVLAARSGGHSYAGYSSTSGLMVDLSLMTAITVGPDGVATLAGGVRNGGAASVLRRQNVSITHGRCLGVGVAAFLLGGGIGFNMRRHGVGCDRVTGLEMVAPDGTILTADPRENADLFWASRGIGGGNLGIHTGFRLQTFEVGDLCRFDLRWTERIEAVAQALLTAIPAGPDGMGSKLTLAATAGRGAAVQPRIEAFLMGQFEGTPGGLQDLLAPALRAAPPVAQTLVVEPYWTAQDRLSEPGASAYYQERSRFMTQAEAVSVLPEILRHLAAPPPLSLPVEAKFFQTGGAINRVAADATAFVHRGSDWLFSLEVQWTAEDGPEAVAAALAWQAALYAAICRKVAGGAFQNFVDPSLESWGEAYYGANLPRLRQVKRRLDPDFVFRFPQAVPPA